MNLLRRASLLTGLMGAAAVAGVALRPGARTGAAPAGIKLDDIVPRRFAGWSLLPDQSSLVVNPQTQQLLDKLYSQLLSRTYVGADGYRIMLSLAYGGDQRGELQAHKPEVCYPAQGFTVHRNVEAALPTPFGTIAVRQLDTSLGARREPVTYWFTIGDTVVQSRFQQRLAEVRVGLTGQVPDGLLFRVSSIDPDTQRAYRQQAAFVADLLAAVPARARVRLSGLPAAQSPG